MPDREEIQRRGPRSTFLEFDGAVYTVTVEKDEDGRTHILFTTTDPPLGLGTTLYEFTGRIFHV